MALIKCKKCGQMISDKAKACPKCGTMLNKVDIGNQVNNDQITASILPHQKHNSPTKWLQFALPLLLLSIACLGGFYYYHYIYLPNNTIIDNPSEALIDLSDVNNVDESSFNDVENHNPSAIQPVKEMEVVEETQAIAEDPNEVYMDLWGNIGEAQCKDFIMNGTTGYYVFEGVDNVRRTMKLVNYDKKTGKCEIDAFLRNKYIGKFVGVFEIIPEPHPGNIYSGKFISVRKGVKLDFYLYVD